MDGQLGEGHPGPAFHSPIIAYSVPFSDHRLFERACGFDGPDAPIGSAALGRPGGDDPVVQAEHHLLLLRVGIGRTRATPSRTPSQKRSPDRVPSEGDLGHVSQACAAAPRELSRDAPTAHRKRSGLSSPRNHIRPCESGPASYRREVVHLGPSKRRHPRRIAAALMTGILVLNSGVLGPASAHLINT